MLQSAGYYLSYNFVANVAYGDGTEPVKGLGLLFFRDECQKGRICAAPDFAASLRAADHFEQINFYNILA